MTALATKFSQYKRDEEARNVWPTRVSSPMAARMYMEIAAQST